MKIIWIKTHSNSNHNNIVDEFAKGYGLKSKNFAQTKPHSAINAKCPITSMLEDLSHAEEEQLLELAAEGFLQNIYKESTLTTF